MEAAVRSALNAKPPAAADKATAELALTLAKAIDTDGVDHRTSGALLAALEALLMTPRALAAAKKAVTNAKPAANPLDQLAARRAGRGRTEAVDAAAT